MLEAQRLVKAYRGIRAVDDVSFAVQRGEIYGFLGPNGAGKTTTLRMLVGLARPDSGMALVRGIDPLRDPVAAHARLGFLPETLSLYKTLSGRQTLRFFAELKGVPAERADEHLALVGLQEAAGKRVGEYSRGMVQRIGLAQALMGEPELLVLDEPTGGLDPLAHRQVKDILRDRSRRGATILFSSHVLSEVQELATRVGILRRGKLVADDTVENLRKRVSLQGAIVVTLSNPSPSLAVEIQQLSGVASARLEGSQLVVECPSELRFDVAKRVDELGGGVVNMETRDASLEDVFVKLAGG
jgi:ABC-2 type transport system ATP-binding protein